ncbi:MAG: hypothetical protein IJG84_07265 [Kiritimatiellae bacterium]|nr:hypothetical protein [Kiritimatiellia bacterium]
MSSAALLLAATLMSLNFNDMPVDDAKPPAGWIAGDWGTIKCRYGSEPDDAGGRAMRVDLRGMFGGQLQVFSPPWPMWQGRWYRVSFRVKGFDHPGTVETLVRQRPYPWRGYAKGPKFRPTNEWKKYSFVWESKHDVQSDFGVMFATGCVGKFLIDDLTVEEFAENPEPPKKVNANPPVEGNLIPRSSFETEGDNFFVDRVFTGKASVDWQDARHSRVADAKFGKYALHLPWMPLPRGTVMSVPIDVAAGRRYVFSAWVKARKHGPCSFTLGGSGGKWKFGKSFNVAQDGEWHLCEVATPPVPDDVCDVILSFSAPNGHDVAVDGMFFGIGEKSAAWKPARPCEVELAFDVANPDETPSVVEWGKPFPLRLAAYLADGGGTREICGELTATAFSGKVTARRKVVLAADGSPLRMDFDPGANGLFRIEFRPDDPSVAAPCEKVMARLPPPRMTGEKGRFGSHFRVCRYFLNYARALGFTWQRLHDCSHICKMSGGNPEPGKHVWFDEQVDAMRSAGLSILALPDAPPRWAAPTNEVGKYMYDAKAFGEWCEAAAAHYRGRIKYWEVWNEPYISGYFFRGTAEEFGPVFNAGAAGLRRGNPDAKVVGWCTELSSPQYVLPFMRKHPLELKPDVNSVHYYFTDVPGAGECGSGTLMERMKKTWGEYAAGEIWNTEGNMGTPDKSFYSFAKVPREELERGAAFGVRCWADTFASGVSKMFLYACFNTDGPRVHGLMNLADYDRAVTPIAAATAVTAYFIDALEPTGQVRTTGGRKVANFAGDGRMVAVVWDDVLEPGQTKINLRSLPDGTRVYDAMGNDLTSCGLAEAEVGLVPLFAVRPSRRLR